jgi:hypothetical protein
MKLKPYADLFDCFFFVLPARLPVLHLLNTFS